MKLTVRAIIMFVSALCVGSEAVFAAAPVAYVAPITQIVTAAHLQSVGDAWIHQIVKDKDHRAVLAYPLSDQHIIVGHVDLKMSNTPTISSNYATLPIEIRVDGQLVRTVYTAYRIETLVQMPVLKITKHRGEILSAEDFHIVQLPDDGRQPVEVSELQGRVLNSDHAAGDVVHLEETSVNAIVKAGAPVVLIVHDGGVALAADVIARTSGGLGETVTVYDDNARRLLSGIVTAPSRVELTLPEVSAQ